MVHKPLLSHHTAPCDTALCDCRTTLPRRYDPGWGMWISSGNHFSFMNQPRAMGKNLGMFLLSLEPLMEGDSSALAELRSVGIGYEALSDEWMR
jgi:hypothetical protein